MRFYINCLFDSHVNIAMILGSKTFHSPASFVPNALVNNVKGEPVFCSEKTLSQSEQRMALLLQSLPTTSLSFTLFTENYFHAVCPVLSFNVKTPIYLPIHPTHYQNVSTTENPPSTDQTPSQNYHSQNSFLLLTQNVCHPSPRLV